MLILPQQVQKILMVNIVHIGDIVLSCPTTRALKTFFPHAEIDMLVSMPQGKAAYHNPYLSEVLCYDIKDWQSDRAKLLNLIQVLRNKKYDLALSSRHGSADPIMTYLSGAVYRAGFDVYGGSKYLTHVVPSRPQLIRHESEYQLELLSILGFSTNDTRIEFLVSNDDEFSLHRKLPHLHKNGVPIVLLCPFSDDTQKNWTHIGYISVLQTLAQFADCYLIGSSSQLTALNTISSCAGNVATALGGVLSLGELGALIKRAALLITVDTGPMHIAQAFQTPVVALMGPTDPKVWGPRNSCDTILNNPLPCSPCWHKDTSIKNNCRINECMRRIKPADVIRSALSILSASSRGGIYLENYCWNNNL